MCIILLVADVNEPGCGRRGATQLDKYHDGGLTPSRDAATAATWVVSRCRGGRVDGGWRVDWRPRCEHSFSSQL